MRRTSIVFAAIVATLLLCIVQAVGASPAHAASNQYVALGDSYSSGVGADVYKSPVGVNAGNIDMASYEPATVTNQCFRNAHAYPRTVATQTGRGLSFVACSGATITDIFNGKSGEPSQLDALSVNTRLVTLTAGGNDAGFMDVMGCILGNLNPLAVCSAADTRVVNASTTIATTLPARYDNLISAIKTRSPQAQIVVVGYGTTLPNQLYRDPLITPSELQIALNLRNSLNGAIAAAAARNSVTFVDPFRSGSPFNRLDTSSANLFSPSATWGTRTEFAFPNFWSSYHPTRAGHDYVSDLILRVVRQ